MRGSFRNASTRLMVSSIRLFGQLAPAVIPTERGFFDGSQSMPGDFFLLMDVKVADLMSRNHAAGIPDEPGRKLLFADFCEVRRVGAIVSSNDDKKIERFVQ